MMMTLGACNKKDDELVLVTTETLTTETTALTTEEVTTEESTESARGSENSISFEDLYECNKGDNLLADGTSYSINTIYYSGEDEIYSEYKFLGFDDQGMYAQVYEDSDKHVEILDPANNYWYRVKDNKVSILLYPEQLVAAAIIESNHNSMILGLSGQKGSSETVVDRYRKDGKLVIETEYSNEAGDKYTLKYILSDDWKVEEYYCFDMEGTKISHSRVTKGVTYDIPEEITTAQAMEDGYRTINVIYVEGEQIDLPFYTPLDIPVELGLIEYEAYSDEACTTLWKEVEPDENGVYMDVTIYMKKQ